MIAALLHVHWHLCGSRQFHWFTEVFAQEKIHQPLEINSTSMLPSTAISGTTCPERWFCLNLLPSHLPLWRSVGGSQTEQTRHVV